MDPTGFLFGNQGFAFCVFGFDLTHDLLILFQNTGQDVPLRVQRILLGGIDDHLVLEQNHMITQTFQYSSDGRNAFFHCLDKFLHLLFQFSQQFVIRFDLAVHLASVRDESHSLQLSCMVSLMDTRLFGQPSGSVAAAVHTIRNAVAFLLIVDNLLPAFSPGKQLILTVPKG